MCAEKRDAPRMALADGREYRHKLSVLAAARGKVIYVRRSARKSALGVYAKIGQ